MTCRGPSRHVTLCLGDRTDALRESGAKRIADWGSDYRVIRGSPEPRPGTPSGTPSGTPRPGLPRGPPPPPAREISGPGPGRPPGAPGAPRDPPAGAPRDPQNGPFLGPILLYFDIRTPLLGGPARGALLGPRGPGTPGGQKSAHFFGYLITLPVGTVWATFSDPPFWAIFGGFRGVSWGTPIGTVFIGSLGTPRRAYLGLDR